MLKKVILIGTLCLLSSCSSLNKHVLQPLNVWSDTDTKPPLNLIEPAPLVFPNIKWTLITDKTGTYYSLTPDDYKNLVLGLGETENYITQEKAIIKAYKDYYEPPDKSVKPAQTKVEETK